MHEIPEIDRKGLREFAFVTGVIVAILFGLFFPWLLERSSPMWPWGVAIALGIWGIVAPDSLRPVYKAWMRLGLLLSRITTPIILGVVFLLTIVPTALILRILGKDPMMRKLDGGESSYRIASHKKPKENLERPF